jgi:hypothetical protein
VITPSRANFALMITRANTARDIDDPFGERSVAYDALQ